MFETWVSKENAPLTVAVFVATYLIVLMIGRFLKRRAGVRLGVLFQLFCLTLAFYAAISVYGVEVPWRRHVGAGVTLLSTAVLVALIDRYLWDLYFEKRRQTVIPRLLRDTIAAVVYLVVILLVLSIGYNAEAELKGLLAGSGVVAIILGFAMQNLLSGIVAGMSLQIQKPYKVGDWLRIGDVFGEVTEINWGATRLRTGDAVYLHIPNNEIIKQTIVNLHYPTPLHAVRIQVGVDYNTPPNRVKDALMRAAQQASGVMAEPQPKVFLTDFGDSAILYEIKFWMTSHAQFFDIADAIRTNIWYEFKRRNITIPFPIRTVQVERKSASAPPVPDRTHLRERLRQEPLFSCLSDEQIDFLLKNADVNTFGRGETVIEEGAAGESMFIIIRGTAQVSVTRNGAMVRVGVLRQGDCFGEMSLLTGEPRSATVRTEEDSEIIELSKAIMNELLRTSPQCLTQLSDLLATRRMETEGLLHKIANPEERREKERDYAASFLRRVRSFFEL